DQDGEADRRFGGRDREHEQREDLADEVVQEARERHQIDVDGEQDQLDRHQDDDDVLAVDEDAEDAEREQDRADREIVSQSEVHQGLMRWRMSLSANRYPLFRDMR